MGMYVPKDSSAVLTIKAATKTIDAGADSGDKPKIGLTTSNQWAAGNLTAAFVYEGVASGAKATGTTVALNNANVKAMTIRKSKPTLASSTLQSTTLSSGTQTFYKWTVSADSAADISWKAVVFTITGTLGNGQALSTIGLNDVEAATTPPTTAGIYCADGTAAGSPGTGAGADDNNDDLLVTGTTLKVYNSATGNQVAGTFYYRVDIDANAGYWLVFVATTEEEVAKGTTKTYDLRGDFGVAPTGASGTLGNVNAKIADLAATGTTATGAFATIVGTHDDDSVYHATNAATTISFIWSDRSAAAHTELTTDWTDDYKVSGVPATTLTMSK
jgi:hypothetical protein